MKQATKLIHAGEGVDTGANAVIDHAHLRDEHVRVRLGCRRREVSAGQAEWLPLLPLREPDGRRGGAEAGGGGRGGDVAAVQQRHGGDLNGAHHAAEERRRDPLLQRDLRRHLSHHRRSPAQTRHLASLHFHRRARRCRIGDRPQHQGRLVRVTDQSNAALRGRSRGCGGLQEGRRAGGDGQHLRQPDQSAGAVDGHRPVDAKLHEVPERAQRRHRRCPVGIVGADGTDGDDAAPARWRHGSATGVRTGTGHEDHAASRGATQCERDDRGAVPRGTPGDRARVLPGIGVASRITRLRRSR